MVDQAELGKLARLIRYYILVCTTEAGSGHPTSSLSATDLMAALLFGGYFRYDADHPEHPNNDRLIFSKGHASPLFYALWTAAGKVTEEELMTYRKFGSPLEGHPTVNFRYVEAATGSLGQGLPIGVGIALNAKYLDKLPYRTYVLLGDSEMAEGSQWEALEIAAHYKLDNLVGIIDVNRLGQRGETMYGWNLDVYAKRVNSFGWETILIDGHNFSEILFAYEKAVKGTGKPLMIIARTIKGKGVPLVEDKNGWHGKPLSRQQLEEALPGLGEVDRSLRGKIARPEDLKPGNPIPTAIPEPSYEVGKPIATRKAYGNALKRIKPAFPAITAVDGEVSNSTFAEIFKDAYPDAYFEMYIAEQNMVGVAQGLETSGKIPFASTFAAFFTRAFDQIRMSQYSRANIKFVGSHAGVSIGEDGPSQMGLEDIAMFRTIQDSVVLYPCDAYATERLVEEAAKQKGIVYIRTTREATPLLYSPKDTFPIGKFKTLRRGQNDAVALIAAGATVFEALSAYDELKKEGIQARVIDLYCIKPIEKEALDEATEGVKNIITVEDHRPEGGIGEAVRSALADSRKAISVYSLAVRKMPRSGKPNELIDYEEISKGAIVKKVKEIL
ncbi:MAG TPA: transketolase [Syntrophorhabdales bacterium]|nr:transketolase [Syntrophorhabdales bacterium]